MLLVELGQELIAHTTQNQVPANGQILADLEVIHRVFSAALKNLRSSRSAALAEA
jgi:hypothetical protein